MTVLFDEDDIELRDWALNDLTEKLREWQLNAYFMVRDEYLDRRTGWSLEKIVMAIDQSKKLIVCLTDVSTAAEIRGMQQQTEGRLHIHQPRTRSYS